MKHQNKTQENHILNKKRQSIDANTEMNLVLKLCVKNFKEAIIKRFDKQLQILLKIVKNEKIRKE